MKRVVRYLCEFCGREYPTETAASSCEKKERKNAKTRLRESKAHERELRRQNLAEWVEDGVHKTAPRVDPKVYGSHKYEEDGTSDCAYGCGCWMGPARSGGPIDPFGPCPCNPKQQKAKRKLLRCIDNDGPCSPAHAVKTGKDCSGCGN